VFNVGLLMGTKKPADPGGRAGVRGAGRSLAGGLSQGWSGWINTFTVSGSIDAE
jgi:hypothetical protein